MRILEGGLLAEPLPWQNVQPPSHNAAVPTSIGNCRQGPITKGRNHGRLRSGLALLLVGSQFQRLEFEWRSLGLLDPFGWIPVSLML